MITNRALGGLAEGEWGQVETLLLSVFGASRLGEFENVVCFWRGEKVVGCVGLNTVRCVGLNTVRCVGLNTGLNRLCLNQLCVEEGQVSRLCLNQLCVEEGHRNRGVASSILEFVSRWYPQDLILYVDKHREGTDYLLEFYCARGFRVLFTSHVEFLLGRDQMAATNLSNSLHVCSS